MSVDGLTKKICQNILSEAKFLPYTVAQRLNEETVTEGINCTENNKIVFLFNTDESGELAKLPENVQQMLIVAKKHIV